MELTKVQKLLEAYFEGYTTLDEEQLLRDYFNSAVVDESLVEYCSLFSAVRISALETSTRTFKVPKHKNKSSNRWWLSIAASIVIVLGVAGFVYSENTITEEEHKALAALKQSKDAMLLLSNNLQKGAGQLQFVETFNKTKNKFLK